VGRGRWGALLPWWILLNTHGPYLEAAGAPVFGVVHSGDAGPTAAETLSVRLGRGAGGRAVSIRPSIDPSSMHRIIATAV